MIEIIPSSLSPLKNSEKEALLMNVQTQAAPTGKPLPHCR
jgi:hypothetical protein